MSLEDALAKIKSPNLQNQQHTSVVLSSIEDTLTDQRTDFTPTAYFAALLSLLRQSGPAALNEAGGSEVLGSTVYLLDLVSSHVPLPLLRAQCSPILSLLAPIFASNKANAPLLRSAIGCLESLLVAQDANGWHIPQTQTSPLKAVPVLLSLALDGRPKIRKRALEALKKVLQQPPQGPALDHPAADLCASIALASLKEELSVASQAKRQAARANDGPDPHLIHLLRLTRAIAVASGGWPSKKIEPLVEALMSISKSSNDYLVMGAFETFEVVFESIGNEMSSSKLSSLLDAIAELRPSENDSQLLPPWVAVLSRGYELASDVNTNDTFTKLPDLVDMLVIYLSQPSYNIRVSASECLISLFANCIPHRAILQPSDDDAKIFEQLGQRANDLMSVKYQLAWMEVCKILSVLIQAMRWRGGQYLAPVVKAVGELRGNDSFQGKKEADELLGRAIRHIGPDVVLSIMPMNLDQNNNKTQGRAWLLPLLRENVSNSCFAHFKSELLPLSEQIYQRVIEQGNVPKTPRIKVFETVIHQIWATFPGYCDLPLDLQSAVDQPFAELISNLLYKQTELRLDLCRGLQKLVESSQAVLAAEASEDDLLYEWRMTRSQAGKNLQHLATLSNNLLAVLFNVYNGTMPQNRGFILQCINAYLSISSEHDVEETFDRVCAILRTSLPDAGDTAPAKRPQSKDEMPPTSHTLFDLVIALSTYLPRPSLLSLFQLASQILAHPHLTVTDPQLIKKVYKLLPHLTASPIGRSALESRNSELQSLLLQTSDKTPVSARRDRLLTLYTLVTFLPTTDLHFIPSVLSEIVLACKDTNQRAREAGFNLLIHCTHRIIDDEKNPPGTVIRNRLVPHMPDDAADAPATLEEMFTMVSAGLAGVATHMVASTVAALARLLFEFHTRLARDMCEDLIGTVEIFLQSRDREIVRSVLGFVKVAVVVLPDPLLNDNRMATMLRGCMVWSNENKGRMRMKVKGILERCIRRFGAGKTEGWMKDNEGGRKLVANIRKRKEKAKRKKKNDADQEGDPSDEETGAQHGKKKQREFDNEFDEAVYGTDENDEDDDSEMVVDGDDDGVARDLVSFKSGTALPSGKRGSKGSPHNKKHSKDQFILTDGGDEDDQDPLDLLGPAALASISSDRNARGYAASAERIKSRRQTKTAVNEEGKLVFHDEDVARSKGRDAPNVEDVLMGGAEEGGEGAVNAYMDAVDGPDAVRRGQRGRLKVSGDGGRTINNKNNDRRLGNGTMSGNGCGDRPGDAMDLDEHKAKQVGRSLTSPRRSMSQIPSGKGRRRGLGVDKNRNLNLSRGADVRDGRGSAKVQKPLISSRGRNAVVRGGRAIVKARVGPSHGGRRGMRGR